MIECTDEFGVHSIASAKLSQDQQKIRVLVEWLYYDVDFNEELLIRVEAITDLLSKEKPAEFLGLDCAGFFHDPSKPAFGLVFPYPFSTGTSQKNPSPKNLANLIEETQDNRYRPFLGDRFKLAHSLAVSVLEFHKVGWLHKTMSSFSVVFFTTVGASTSYIRNPFLLGFSQSRPNEPNALTRGVSENEEEYQHPRYLEQGPPYVARYDYYSLGLILLEIGLWKTIGAIRRDLKASDLNQLR